MKGTFERDILVACPKTAHNRGPVRETMAIIMNHSVCFLALGSVNNFVVLMKTGKKEKAGNN